MKVDPFKSVLIAFALFALPVTTLCAPPSVNSQPAYQSPVRAEPNDLLLLSGEGFSADDIVVYRIANKDGDDGNPPLPLPKESTSALGVAEVVSVANVPNALTVKMPASIDRHAHYRMWVVNRALEWSAPVSINDPRPLWISPAYAYETASIASLSRYVKVIGRNLRAVPGSIVRIKLSGLVELLLADAQPSTEGVVDGFVAMAALPTKIPPGHYAVSISVDGAKWRSVDTQRLIVLADPRPTRAVPMSQFGCGADDDSDDTKCLIAAIRAAAEAGGGSVELSAGVWRLNNSNVEGVTPDGIVVPVGVNLKGAGSERSTLIRAASWNCPSANGRRKECPTLTLQGRNELRGVRFKDERRYAASEAHDGPAFVQLGKKQDGPRRDSVDPKQVADITIAENVFERPFIALGSGSLPIERLVVVDNEFGAFKDAINLSGNRFNVDFKFSIDDTIITRNKFIPGSYLDVAARQGSIASHLGASRRLDFSDNVADGADDRFLYDRLNDAKGWRAAYFWHLNGNHEMLLVAGNEITCSGDKTGDGEAIAFDNNANTFAFTEVRKVLAVGRDFVTVDGPLVTKQNGESIPADFYARHWLQIVDGKGVGQSRKIESYVTDARSGRVTFKVTPKWDVSPAVESSRVTVGRQFWQAYVLNNTVDHRTQADGKSRCLKSNRRSAPTEAYGAGTIALWAQIADSVVEGNSLFDTTGIRLNATYRTDRKADCPECSASTSFLSFVEVRGNRVVGEYNWNSDCSWSGINLLFGASTDRSRPPPVASFGLAIANNTIDRADGLRGGGISLALGWLNGPPPHDWHLIDNTLVFGNTLSNLPGTTGRELCDHRQTRRIGINLNQAMTWRTVLSGNTCTQVASPLVDAARFTVRDCPRQPSGDSCECSHSLR